MRRSGSCGSAVRLHVPQKGGWTVSAIALSTAASSRWTSRPRSRYKEGEPKEFAAMAEFPRKTPADWRAQEAKDLKGRSPDDLTWETQVGIVVTPQIGRAHV